MQKHSYEIQTYNELSSTNSWLHAYAKKSAKDGLVIRAEHQTAGKGTRLNRWEVQPNTNLTFSILHKTPKNAGHRIGFVCANAIIEYLGGKGICAKAKWPNDVLIGNKKIAGILVENQQLKATTYSTIGIGINVNQITFAPELRATSMKLVTDTTFDLTAELNDFLAVFATHWKRLQNEQWNHIDSEMDAYLWRKNQITVVEIDGVRYNSRILGFDESGRVRLELEDLPEIRCLPHEVRFLY